MAVKTFEELFIDEMKDMYDAEKRIVKALPKMIKAVGSPELSTALSDHLAQTDEHVSRLEQAFDQLGMSPERKSCEAMKGLLAESEELADESDDKMVNDAAIIAAAQKVEHYEIATYGTLREWARQLGHPEIAALLQETLDEEGTADKTLSRIAGSLNVEAATHARGH